MQRYWLAAASGLLFGLGLAIAGMTQAAKVLGFLDLAGQWDPSLLLVLGGAVTVSVIAFHWVLRRPAPYFDQIFCLPRKSGIDRPLVLGSALFGIGWGISGYCPGPAIALLANPLLANPNWETWVFVPAMFAGFALHRFSRRPSQA